MSDFEFKRHNEEHGYWIMVKGYIPDYLKEDLKAFINDLAQTNTLETHPEIEKLVKDERKNGLVIRFVEYANWLDNKDLDIEEPGTIFSIFIKMRVRRSILRLLRETFSY